MALFIAIAGLLLISPANAGSKIKILVNGEPITTYDIARRAAFFKLRRIRGNRTKLATEELIEEALKMQFAKRHKMVVGDKQVNDAYARFAKSNKMPIKALDRIMARSGVTKSGFKKFIRAQMSWQRVWQAKSKSENKKSSPEAIFANIKASGGKKPSTTEYKLQQVIFVVPKAKRRALMAKRRREARAFRARFENCKTTIHLAKGLRDVTVRSLGRVMQPLLPPDWKKLVISTPEGKTTKIRDTHRGVEFLAVCEARSVSDDRVAIIESQGTVSNGKASDAEKKFIAKLREIATITRR